MIKDQNFDTDEIQAFILEQVPVNQRALVLRALTDADTPDAIDDIGRTLSGEKIGLGSIVSTGGGSKGARSFWAAVQEEVRDYLCTSSSKYRAERKKAGSAFDKIAGAIAGYLVSQFHIGFSVVIGIVTVALIGAFKVGRNAWCSIQGHT